ncbi:D-glucuronyl C5-epimerase family protein [Haladaptatus sp. CMSO5]|uniref:D-glucuronyl C5-epimerase family protein n=1 Tax=Haladaptatus sp. CMSO5 TaxID=3120514 RepID=UPI002FCE2869
MGKRPPSNRLTTSRRRLLALAGAFGLAGCSQLPPNSDDSGATTARTTTTEPTETQTTETQTTTESPEPTHEALVGEVPIQRTEHTYRELPYEKRPQFFGAFRDSPPECRTSPDALDSVPNLIPATVDGETGHFPLRTTRWLLRLLHCYRTEGDAAYLEKAEEMSQALVDDAAVGENDGLYFSYRLDKAGSSAELKAPWYSGMCQGVGLSAYTYFHELTGDEKYKRLAQRVFQTFKSVKRTTDGPWTTMVDSDGYYWVEEYPFEPPTHVLNGYCIGIWGLYDYWLHTKSAEAKRLLDASVTTIQQYAENLRVPGEVSYYGLDGHRRWELGQTERYPDPYRGNDYYHGVHLIQLGKLYQITDDDYFREVRELYESDDPGDMS